MTTLFVHFFFELVADLHKALIVGGGVLLALSIHGCATPLVATIETNGKAFVAFDGAHLVALGDGAGTFELSAKGSAAPMYLFAFHEGEILVARIGDSRYSERVDAGELIPLEGAVIVRTVLSETQIEELGLVLEPEP